MEAPKPWTVGEILIVPMTHRHLSRERRFEIWVELNFEKADWFNDWAESNFETEGDLEQWLDFYFPTLRAPLYAASEGGSFTRMIGLVPKDQLVHVKTYLSNDGAYEAWRYKEIMLPTGKPMSPVTMDAVYGPDGSFNYWVNMTFKKGSTVFDSWALANFDKARSFERWLDVYFPTGADSMLFSSDPAAPLVKPAEHARLFLSQGNTHMERFESTCEFKKQTVRLKSQRNGRA